MSLRVIVLASASLLIAASGCSHRGSHSSEFAPTSAPSVSAAPPSSVVAPPAPVVAATPKAPWSAETPVGRIVAEHPPTARVLERAGIDYCCGGATPLGRAVLARGAGLDVTALLAELAKVRETPPAANERVWTDAPVRELIDHIQKTHHAYLREELPRLAALVEKVRVVHGAAHPELAEVSTLYAALARELPPHLDLEEQRLFPAIAALEGGRPAPPADVLPALELMESQHDAAGAALHRLRELTKGYAVPSDACSAYKQMLTGLEALEADLHEHVHLENNVLAPKVRELRKA